MERKALNKIYRIIMTELELDDASLSILYEQKGNGKKLTASQLKSIKKINKSRKDWLKILKLVSKGLDKGNKNVEMFKYVD